jgi:hypothetical protein
MGLRFLLLRPPLHLLLLCSQLAVYCCWCQLQMMQKHKAPATQEDLGVHT